MTQESCQEPKLWGSPGWFFQPPLPSLAGVRRRSVQTPMPAGLVEAAELRWLQSSCGCGHSRGWVSSSPSHCSASGRFCFTVFRHSWKGTSCKTPISAVNLDRGFGAEFISLSLNMSGGGYFFYLKDCYVHITLMYVIVNFAFLAVRYQLLICSNKIFPKPKHMLLSYGSSQLKLSEAFVKLEQNSPNSAACRCTPETTWPHTITLIETIITSGLYGIELTHS